MSRPWYRQLNGYHWLVLVVCTLAWTFDCLNQQVFNLTRKPAMAELLHKAADDPAVTRYCSWATALLLIGWGTGGIFFGVLGDRIGRVKTLTIMILCYSLSTGFCGLSRGPWDFCFWCFITGLGIGGIFPVGCALVAESLPAEARPQALGMLQAFSALGNVGAGLISLGMIELWSRGVVAAYWRWMFAVGVVPALLAVIVVKKLREPEAWKAAVAAGKTVRKAGSLGELFGDPRWRRNAIVGLMLAVSGVVGLWGIGVFSNDLTQSFMQKRGGASALRWAAVTLIMFNVGAFFGIYAFARITQRLGRRLTFALAFAAAGLATAATFRFMSSESDIFWMTPLMGACQLSIFGGYAIYFPELFPTRLRSTGMSFCYNFGRYVAAGGALGIGFLRTHVFYNPSDPVASFRNAGVAMCCCFLIGMVALLFAPETKGKPLPE